MRYTLVQDDSCHWYIIPADKKEDWYKWEQSEEAELGHIPDWADHFGSGPEAVTFTDPEIFGTKLKQ